MRTVLNVAEKPSIAKELSKALSQGLQQYQDVSYSKFNAVQRVQREFLGEESMVYTTSVTGHMTNMQFEVGNSNWNSTEPKSFIE